MTARLAVACTALTLVLGAGAVLAGPVPYPTPGTPNPVMYTFTATTSGDIDVYFAGSGASLDEQIGMLVNGTPSGVVGLDDQSSAIGQELDLGPVTAGDTITFFDVITNGSTWYSDQSLNTDGGNHVYSTSVTAGQVFPGSVAGTYVGFEDLAFPGSDYNYFDDTFVFTNVTTTSSVPEPAAWALMLAGFAGLGVALRRRRLITA